MKNILRVTATVAATMLLGTQTLMPATVFADNQSSLSAQQILAQLDTEEQEKFETLTDYLGITDLNAFFDEVRSQSYSPDDYIDLDGDGDLTGDDVDLLGRFLNGMADYPYDYNDMDATNDHVVDYADEVAYMGCYSYHILLHYPFTPGTHGYLRTVDTNFENRQYVACSYPFPANGSGPTLSTYWLTTNDLTAPSSISEIYRMPNHTKIETRTNNYDTRMVSIGALNQNNQNVYSGIGFIVGEHTIATAAHCVFNRNLDGNGNMIGFNSKRTVHAFTYPNNVATITNLTISKIHVPYNFINGTGNVVAGHDYALIEVENDLSSYGAFELGMLLDDTPYMNPNNVSQEWFLTANNLPVTTPYFSHNIINGFYNVVSTTATNGVLTQATHLLNMIFDDLTGYGASNSPSVSISGSVTYYSSIPNHDSAIGIATSQGGTSTIQGVTFAKPLLIFYQNNPYL